MHKTSSVMTFCYPNDEYIFKHEAGDVVMKLKPPSPVGLTKRCSGKFIFPVDLTKYDPL
jgi:hypothetical protein